MGVQRAQRFDTRAFGPTFTSRAIGLTDGEPVSGDLCRCVQAYLELLKHFPDDWVPQTTPKVIAPVGVEATQEVTAEVTPETTEPPAG